LNTEQANDLTVRFVKQEKERLFEKKKRGKLSDFKAANKTHELNTLRGLQVHHAALLTNKHKVGTKE
jgi:hypothetical protein